RDKLVTGVQTCALPIFIRDGKLELSLSDALALALENNLDIAVQRYVIPYAKTDVLRTRAGQAARGFPGALVPGGLTAGAIGAGEIGRASCRERVEWGVV